MYVLQEGSEVFEVKEGIVFAAHHRGTFMAAYSSWRMKRSCASRRRYSSDLFAARVESLSWRCRIAALLYLQYKHP